MLKSYLSNTGTICKLARRRAGVSVKTVSAVTGYAESTIYQFESCRNDNLAIFAYYLAVFWDGSFNDFLEELMPNDD